MPRRKTEEKAATVLIVPLAAARDRVSRQISSGRQLLETTISSQDELHEAKAEYHRWWDYNAELLKQIVNTDQLAQEFQGIAIGVVGGRSTLSEEIDELRSNLRYDLNRLSSIHDKLELFPVSAVDQAQDVAEPLEILEQLFRRFHVVVRQLRKRHSDRPTLEVEDEYDVQDLLHALLKLSFGDIRPEEWTPSYAGGASRMDFLLKTEQTVIEVKKTRQGLGTREVGDQLIIDIGRYQAHPDCRSLICFIYDPEGRIDNPDGLETDLSRSVNGMLVKAIVAPKGQ